MNNPDKRYFWVMLMVLAASALVPSAVSTTYEKSCINYFNDGEYPCYESASIELVEGHDSEYYFSIHQGANVTDLSFDMHSAPIENLSLDLNNNENIDWSRAGNYTGPERIDLTSAFSGTADCNTDVGEECSFYLIFGADQYAGTVNLSNISLVYDYVYPADAILSTPLDGADISMSYATVIFYLYGQNVDRLPISSAYLTVDGVVADTCSHGCSGNLYSSPYNYYLVMTGLAIGQHSYNVTIGYDGDYYASETRTLQVNGPVFIDDPNNGTYRDSQQISVQYYSYWNLSDGYALFNGAGNYSCSLDQYDTGTVWPSSKVYDQWSYVCSQTDELSQGENRYTIYASLNGTEYSSEETTFYVDSISPSVNISAPEHGATVYGRHQSITFEAADNQFVESCEIHLGGENIEYRTYHEVSVSDSFTVEFDETGEQSVYIYCYDQADNEGQDSVEVDYEQICDEEDNPKTSTTYVTEGTKICPGNYTFSSGQDHMYVISGQSDILFDCNGSTYTTGSYGKQAFRIIDSENVTVKNCILQNYVYGVYVENSEDVVLENLDISSPSLAEASEYGIFYYNVSNSTIASSSIRQNAYAGMYMTQSDNNYIMGNMFQDNAQKGLQIAESKSNRIYLNDFYDEDNVFYIELNDYCYMDQENTYHGFSGPNCANSIGPYNVSRFYNGDGGYMDSTLLDYNAAGNESFLFSIPTYGNYLSASMRMTGIGKDKGVIPNGGYESSSIYPWMTTRTNWANTGETYASQDAVHYSKDGKSARVRSYIAQNRNDLTQTLTMQDYQYVYSNELSPEYISLSMYSDLQENPTCYYCLKMYGCSAGYCTPNGDQSPVDSTYDRYARQITLSMCDNTGCTDKTLFLDYHDHGVTYDYGTAIDVLGNATYLTTGADGRTWGRYVVPWPAERTSGYYYVKISASSHKWGECTACSIAIDYYVDDVCFSNSAGTCVSLPDDYPSSLQVDIGKDGAIDHSLSGTLYGRYDVPDYAGLLNEIASGCNCPGCYLNGYYCEITSNIYSSNRGTVNLSDLDIRYDTIYRNEYRFLDPTPANDSYTGRDDVEIKVRLSQDADNATLVINGVERPMQQIDSITYTYGTSSHTTQLPEGAYSYRIKAAGSGLYAESKTRIFTIDRTGPQINITSPAEGEEFSYDDITLDYNASEPLSRVQYDVDCIGSPIVSGEQITVYDLEKGNRTLSITAWDRAGNTGSASVNYRILNDTTPPAISLIGARSYYNTPNVTLHVYVNERISNSTYALDEGNASAAGGFSYGTRSTEYYISFENLSEGIHYVYVNATDQDDNVGFFEANYTVDLTMPEVSADYPDSFNTTNRSLTFCYNASDVNGIDTCEFQSESLGDESTSFGSQEVHYCVNRTTGSGNYSWNVSCADAAGNVQTTSTKNFENIINVSAYYDEGTPEDNATTGATGVTIYVYADWNVSGCNITWNGSVHEMNITDTTCYKTFSNLSDGDYYYNTTVQSDIYTINLPTRSLTVYTVPPTVSINQPIHDGIYASADVNFSYSVDQPTTEVAYKLDDRDYVAVSGNYTLHELSNGRHTTTIRAMNAYGKYGNASVNFSIDTTGPQITISSPADGYSSNDRNVSIEFNLSENVSTLTLEYDGANQTQNTSNICSGLSCTITKTNVSDGTHTYKIYATDAYGNPSQSQQRSYTVAYVPAECRVPESGDWTITGNCDLRDATYHVQNRNVRIRNGANTSYTNCTFKLGSTGSFGVENANLTMTAGSRIESTNQIINITNSTFQIDDTTLTANTNISVSGTSKGTLSDSALDGKLFIYGADVNVTGNNLRGIQADGKNGIKITGNTITGPMPLAPGIGIYLHECANASLEDNAISGYLDVVTDLGYGTSTSPGTCIMLLDSSAVIENTTAEDCSHSIDALLSTQATLRGVSFNNVSEFHAPATATAYDSYLGALVGGNPTSNAANVSLINSTYASISGHEIYEYMPVVVKVVNGSAQGISGVEVRITNDLGGVYATPYYNGTDNRTNASGTTQAINLLNKYRDRTTTHTVTNTIYLYKNMTSFTDTFPKTIDASSAHTETYTAETGQWVVSGNETAPTTKSWSNDILVTGTGNLTLRYSTLLMEPASEGAIGITVLNGGRLTIEHSTVNSSNGRRYYIYGQPGSIITILDSNIGRCGCDPSLASCEDTKYGVTIEGSASVHNGTFTNCYYALNLRSGTTVNDGNTFENNYAGIHITGTADAKIDSDTLRNNVYGVIIESCAGAVNVSNNTFRNNSAAGIYVYDSTPTFRGNDIDAGPGAYGYNGSRYAVIVNHTSSYANYSDDHIKGYTNQSGPVALYLVNGAKARLTNCTIEAGYNKESRGIVAENSTLQAVNSTVYGYRTRTVCTQELWGESCDTYQQGDDAVSLYASNASFSGGNVIGGESWRVYETYYAGGKAINANRSRIYLSNGAIVTGGYSWIDGPAPGIGIELIDSLLDATYAHINGGRGSGNVGATAIISRTTGAQIIIRNSSITGGTSDAADGTALEIYNTRPQQGGYVNVTGSRITSAENHALWFQNASGIYLYGNAVQNDGTLSALYVKDAPTTAGSYWNVSGNVFSNPAPGGSGAGIEAINSSIGFYNNSVAGFYDGIHISGSQGFYAYNNRIYANRDLGIYYADTPNPLDRINRTYFGHYPPENVSGGGGADINYAGKTFDTKHRGGMLESDQLIYIKLANITTYNGTRVKNLNPQNLSDNYVYDTVRMRYNASSTGANITQALFYVVDEENDLLYVTADTNPADGIDFWWDNSNYSDVRYRIIAVAYDSLGYTAIDSYTLAILKPRLQIIGTSVINPTMIYTMSKGGNGSVQADRRYRAATVKINVTNTGTASGAAIVRLDNLPDGVQAQHSLVAIAPGQTKELSYTFEPTYTYIADGWWPAGYSLTNNTIWINATAASIMGHVFDSRAVNLTLGIGPKFEITSFSHGQSGDEGDDDGIHEACESYHITVSIINRGDPVWVTRFGFAESDGNNSWGDAYYYSDVNSPFLGAYGLWATGETRTLTNRYVETWLMNCDQNYSGNYKVYPYVHFYLPGDANKTDYYTSSVNRKEVPVIAFEKTLNESTHGSGPMEFTQLGVDEDDVNLVLKNTGDVYYEYGSRGYDSNAGWDQHWYWVMPPGTDANYRVKNARIKIGNSTTINYRYDVRYDWSLFFNELDGGLIVVDAAIEFMVDEAGIKEKLEKFGLDLSARDIIKGIIDMILEHYNQQDLSASGILHDIATNEQVQEWLLDRIINNVIGSDSVSEFYDDVKEGVEFQEWLSDTGQTIQDFENEDSSGKFLMFVKYLADKFKEGILENFGEDIPFLGSFIDLGEWFGTNLFAEHHIQVHVDIIDPAGEFNVYTSEQPLVFGSANNASNATGYGTTNLTLSGNGNDTRDAFYQSSISPLADDPLLAADFESIETTLEGVRVNGSMVGNVTILFKYKDNPNGTMIDTLKNDLYAKPLLEQFFSDMTYHIIDLTVNNTLRYYGEGTYNVFAVSPYDSEIHTSVSSTENGTNATIESTGNYSETVGNNTVFTANFAPAYGIPLNATNLTVTLPENNTVYNGGQNGTGVLQFRGIPEEGLEIISGNETPSTEDLAPKITFLYPLASNRVITAGEDIIYSIEEQHLDTVRYSVDGAGYVETNNTGVVKTQNLVLGAHTLILWANDSFGYYSNETLEFQVQEATTTSSTTLQQATTTVAGTTTTTSIIWQCIKPGNEPPCSEVSLDEVVNAINLWANGTLTLNETMSLINSYADPVNYPPEQTTSTTTTTTLPAACEMPGNALPCNVVTEQEVVNAINEWTNGTIKLGDLIDLIDSWSDPLTHPSD